jgi:hypothetical protein
MHINAVHGNVHVLTLNYVLPFNLREKSGLPVRAAIRRIPLVLHRLEIN